MYYFFSGLFNKNVYIFKPPGYIDKIICHCCYLKRNLLKIVYKFNYSCRSNSITIKNIRSRLFECIYIIIHIYIMIYSEKALKVMILEANFIFHVKKIIIL